MRTPSKSVPSRVAALPALTAWLMANGAHLNGAAIEWLGGRMGVGLVATRSLSAGAVACVVPHSLLLSRDSGLHDPHLGPLLADSTLIEELQDESNGFDESIGIVALQLLQAAAAIRRGDQTPFEPYVRALPQTVDSPLLWPRTLRKALLTGTSLLHDTRELRAAAATELRRVRRCLRQADPAWLVRLGLDASVPCPFSGESTPLLERWLLAITLVRSRAYTVSRLRRQDDGGWATEETVLSPLIDLANHDDALKSRVVEWSRDAMREAAASDASDASAEPVNESEDARCHQSRVCPVGCCARACLGYAHVCPVGCCACACLDCAHVCPQERAGPAVREGCHGGRSHPIIIRSTHANLVPANLWLRQ